MQEVVCSQHKNNVSNRNMQRQTENLNELFLTKIEHAEVIIMQTANHPEV